MSVFIWVILSLSLSSESCSPPPAILHGISHLYKYNRLQRSFQSIEDGQVAIYRCNSGYELKKHNSNRLLCSGGQWIGRLPVCGELIQPIL